LTEAEKKFRNAIDRLRDQQNRYLPKMMRLCATAHPHFRRVFDQLGLEAEDIKAVEDLRRLPILTKQDYISDPESFRLDLGDVPGLTPEEITLADVIYTAGTSGKPTPFYDTAHDRFARVHHLKRIATIAGIGPEDTVMNLFPLSAVPHQGFLSAQWGATTVGAKLLSGLTGPDYPDFPVHRRMDEAIEMIERGRATVLWGITTYVRRLLLRAQEQGRDFSPVRLAMVMGEPCPPGVREDIRARLQSMGSESPWINNGYGITETQGPAIQCAEESGTHQAVPEQFYFEIVDPLTGEPLPDGKPGRVLLSHLNRRGTVLLRYSPGDIAAMTHETCPHCGRWGPRFVGSPYRADSLMKVKGTLLNPAALHEQMTPLFKEGVSEYQVVISREDVADRLSPDRLVVKLACAREDRSHLEKSVVAIVKRTAEITPVVEFLPPDGLLEIARDYKFKRFVDERNQ